MNDWSLLKAALARCRADGVEVPLWWRDDDAIAPTPALDQLCDLSAQTGLPVHLAVIPAHATIALAAEIANRPMVQPVVHGWNHKNTAPAGQKKSEFGSPRTDAKAQARQALTWMQELFGTRLVPMFVPPWNRLDRDLIPDLAALGYACVSTYGSRKMPAALPQINTHVDPIFWRGTRSLVPAETLICDAVTQLEARRTGAIDATEPFGLLTHHLVHDAAIWEFSRQFILEMRNGGAPIAELKDHMT